MYYDPKRKGLLGRMETVVSPEGEITYKAKGVSKKKTFAGMSDEALTKRLFSDVGVGKGERSKIVNHMVKQIKQLGCGLYSGGRVDFAKAGTVDCFAKGLQKIKTKNIVTKGDAAIMKKIVQTGSKKRSC